MPEPKSDKSLHAKLVAIQQELEAPKSQHNSFGGYDYRSCEDILQALKPLLIKHGCTIRMIDEPIMVGERHYIKSEVQLSDEANTFASIAYAREEETKKGMDGSQITGAASSYARKYALNGLFAIDDARDSDSTNHHDPEPSKPHYESPQQPLVNVAESRHCSIHNVDMPKKISKAGKPYFAHAAEGGMCFGAGVLPPKPMN